MDAHLGPNEIRSPNSLFIVLIHWNSDLKKKATKNFDAKFTIREAGQRSVFLVFPHILSKAIGLCRYLHISH